MKKRKKKERREARSRECQWRKMYKIQRVKINCTISSKKENEIKVKTYERQCAFKMTMVWSHSHMDWLRTKHI